MSIPIAPILEHLGCDEIHRIRHRGWTKIKCFIHEDSRASATVSLEANRFHCFAGCTDRPEDAVGLIAIVEGLAFPEAKKKAEELSGVKDDGERRKRRRSAIPSGDWFLD